MRKENIISTFVNVITITGVGFVTQDLLQDKKKRSMIWYRKITQPLEINYCTVVEMNRNLLSD